jgi:PKD repeat protein
MLMCFTAFKAEAQDIVYRDTFRNGVPATTAQITRWNNFRAKLLANLAYTSVTIRGEYDVTGYTCNDAAITKAFAAAVRTNTAYASATTNGHVWSICNRYDGEIWIDPPSTCSGSNCPSPGYIIRPGIGTANSNWGGINTATCGGSNQWMELRFKVVPPYNWNAATVAFTKLDPCITKQDMVATIENAGKKDIDSFQVYVKVNSTTYGPTWNKTKIATGKQATVTVYSGFTFTPNTAYTVTVWTDKPNNNLDSFRGNDTMIYKFGFFGFKGTPNAIDTNVCGSQSLVARCIPAQAGDSVAWFSDRALAGMIGTGPKYTTKYLSSGATYKFYAASYNGFSKGALNTGYTFTNSWQGTMFNLTATDGDLLIDSLGINLYSVGAPPGNNTPLEIWVRQGGFSGFETDPTKWTKVWTGQILSKGTQQRTLCPWNYTLSNGVVYGVYLNFTNGARQVPLLKPSGQTFTNADLTLQGGTMNGLDFGAVIQTGTFDGEVFYRKLLCKSKPDSATIVVNPAPFGAKLEAGFPFQTAPKNSGSGVVSKPHVVAMGDTLALNLAAPTGYIDGDHNTTWKVANVQVKSMGGRALNFGWTDPKPNAGRLVYTPDASMIDSVLKVMVRIQQIGGPGCDTNLVHYIYVAPLPEPNFSRNAKICDGDPIEFTNKSKILKGFIDYKWYFGDGDSSEAQDPIKQYASFGVYYCKLNAISSIYGYVRTKIDTITVTQIPLVKFKVLNACETKAHSFVNQTTVNAGTLSYSWDFGDNTPKSTQKDPSHLYASVGQYKVTLTASANGCSAVGIKNAYVFPKPKASYSFDNSKKYCTNTPVSFTNTSTISSGNMGVKWKFEAGQLGTIDVPMHTFKTAGTYDVKAIAISEFGCMDSATKTVTVFEAPKVSFTNSSACDLTPTQFTNNTPDVPNTVDNYKWSFGDGNSSTALSPSHQYTQLGPKTVKLVVSTSSGCADSASKEIVVGTQANVDFDAQAACSGEEVQFDNKTKFPQGEVKYKWYFGGVDSSSLADPKYTFKPTNTTTYNITLKVTVDGGCESIVTKPLNILEKPTCNFTISDGWNTASGGYGYRTVNVAAGNTTYPYYRYKFSDGGSLTSATGEYQFPYEGDFTVTMIARNAVNCECTSTQTKSIRNAVGTENLSNGEVRVYPNPSTGVVNIEAIAGTEIQSLKVFNLLGSEVTVVTSNSDSKGSIEFGNAANGVYLVKIATNKGTVTRRVTIQH